MPSRKPHTANANPLNRYRSIVIGILFALLLALPGLDQWLGFSAAFKSTEKHLLAPLPTLRFPHFLTFIHQFNQYYKENFGGRNALFYAYSHVKYERLGISPLPQKVVVGKKGWLFPGNDLNRVTDQHIGLAPLSHQTLQSICRKLSAKQANLAKQGIQLYVLIPPDSYSIYPEYLPDHLQRCLTTSNLDRFAQYLTRHTTVPLIDVRAALVAAKSKRTLYMQTDTHWNEYGALVATLTTVGRLRQAFPGIPSFEERNYTIQAREGYAGDLATMMALHKTIKDKTTYRIEAPTALKTQQIENNNPLGENGCPSQRFISQNTNAPTLLLLGDSFTYSLNQLLPGYFSQTHVLRNCPVSDLEILKEKPKPDIVLIEMVERNLNELDNP